jgi:hypothetical protein
VSRHGATYGRHDGGHALVGEGLPQHMASDETGGAEQQQFHRGTLSERRDAELYAM